MFVGLKNHCTTLKQKNSLRSNSFCFLTLRYVVFFNAQQPRRSKHFSLGKSLGRAIPKCNAETPSVHASRYSNLCRWKDRPYINFRKATTCSGKQEKQTKLIAKQGKIPALPAARQWDPNLKALFCRPSRCTRSIFKIYI